MRVVVVNDCSGFQHFGCILVMETYHEQLERVGTELVGTVTTRSLEKQSTRAEALKMIGSADLVIVNGEGSLHDDAHPELFALAKEFPCILMNTVFQNNKKVEGIKDFLAVFVREGLSWQAIMEHIRECEKMPDIILTSKRLNKVLRMREPTNTVITTDSSSSEYLGLPPYFPPELFFRLLSYGKRVVCGRFHAALACAVIGIPFTAYGGNTHKILGLLMDMGHPEAYAPTRQEAGARTPVASENIRYYVRHGKEQIDQFFERLANSEMGV